MVDTPLNGETASQETVSNDVSQTTVPVTDNSAADPNLQKELEQLRMRNNQLANQLDEKRKAEEAARQKQLEEQEEFKTLYEQTQERLNQLEGEAKAQEERQKLQAATDDVLKEYSDDVKELAKTAGLNLSEDTDEARNALKEKLDTFKAKVSGTTASVAANNGYTPPQEAESRQALTARDHPGGESPMALAGARGDETVALKYISQLPAIQRMKEIASKGN